MTAVADIQRVGPCSCGGYGFVQRAHDDRGTGRGYAVVCGKCGLYFTAQVKWPAKSIKPKKKEGSMKLPKAVKEAFDEFDAAARDHGWQSDQGSAEAAEDAAKRYEAAEEELFKAINAMRRNDRRRA